LISFIITHVIYIQQKQQVTVVITIWI